MPEHEKKDTFQETLADAEQGKAAAQFALAQKYELGIGIANNNDEAVKWYTLAAKQGYALAQNNLANMYLKGTAVPKNDEEAVRLFSLAANQGLAIAQNNLGYMYKDGIGISKNNEEAAKLYALAAKQGYAPAQYVLGCFYSIGIGVKKNEKEANKWLQLAAAQNWAEACYRLARIYSDDSRGKENVAEAVQWYHKAKKLGLTFYDQLAVNTILTQFCNDARYNAGKKRFNEKAIKSLIKGTCAGLTSRFLVGAYLEKNPPAVKEAKDEIKKEKSIRDDLTQFYLERDTILNWDGQRELTRVEQHHFFSYLYTTYGFHIPSNLSNSPLLMLQSELNNFVFLDNEEKSFKKEFSCTLCVTQEQLAKKLELLRKTNRLIFISRPCHAAGLFENRFYGPNNREGAKEYKSSKEIAKAIFEEMNFDPLKPSIFSINIFAKTNEPILATYPIHEELLADCAPGNVPDPRYKTKRNALHESIRSSQSIECVRHYLKTCDVNAKDFMDYTPFQMACGQNRKDIARLLIAHGAQLSSSPYLFNLTKHSKFCAKIMAELIQEKSQNLESASVQEWIRNEILPERYAQVLDSEQRSVLEIATEIARELKIPLKRESKNEKADNFSIDETICHALRQIRDHIESKNEYRTVPKALAFYTALNGLDLAATQMNVIQERLRHALCDMESSRIKSEEFNKIVTDYFAYKGRFYTSKPSQESLDALTEMKEAKTESLRSQVALKFIKTYPTHALAEKIEEVIPALRKIH